MTESTVPDFYVIVTSFSDGLQKPPENENFQNVREWRVTDDNTLLLRGDNFTVVFPPGMWQSVEVRWDDIEPKEEPEE